ncbi:MAG: diacylglycerol/lipid kinase family protein [Thermodesulfobacteriota bacterium]
MNISNNNKYLIIINPRSGVGINNDKITRIKSFLNDKTVNYEIQYTTKRGDAEKIAGSAIENGFSHIVSVGGDGTSSEIVNAIQGEEIIFTVIPCGSGNDFPKAAGIPTEFIEALENVVTGKVKMVDIGKFRDRYFINGLGIGLDGAVAKRFKQLKLLGGFSGYLVGAVVEAFKFSGFKAEINVNGNLYKDEFILVGASNGPTQGGIRLAPEASVSDNLLDIHFISDMTSIKRLITLTRALNAKHTEMKEVSIIKLESAEISVDRDLPAHMDGETFELNQGTHSLGLIKNGLKVLTHA